MAKKSYQRHPIKNFLIKKDLQIRFIVKIILSVIITAALTIAVLTAVYYYKSGSGYFYFMSKDLLKDLEQQSILETILPSLLIAEFISILVGCVIGLVSSRKFAVPIYKMEVWVSRLIKGDYKAQISFREKDEFESLCKQCNLLSSSLQLAFSELAAKLESIEKAAPDNEIKGRISQLRNSLLTEASA